MTTLLALYVLPPFAIAPLGASETPAEAFDWSKTRRRMAPAEP